MVIYMSFRIYAEVYFQLIPRFFHMLQVIGMAQGYDLLSRHRIGQAEPIDPKLHTELHRIYNQFDLSLQQQSFLSVFSHHILLKISSIS